MLKPALSLAGRRVATSLLLAGTLALSGCSGVDGVALNGAVFDWMGISDSALSKKQTDPKLAERPPLVLPPDTNRLPEPGSAPVAQNNDLAWPTDPEQRKVADAKERERRHLAYCRGEVGWEKKALDPQNPNVGRSPYGPCPSLGSVGSIINKN